MYGQIATVAFVGIEAKPVEVQVRISSGGHVFAVVGLPDKAVAESRERVRNALHAVGLGLPYKHITVNLAPADLPKEGSHFDLPIALAMMVAMGAISPDAIEGFAAIGELALDASIRAVPGALPVAIGANAMGKGLICPGACGPEAAWAGEDMTVLAAPHLLSLVNHFKGLQTLPRPKPNIAEEAAPLPDLRDVKGQETAKRALEIAAAGGHNLLMIGAPGSGKSMLAARLPSILPPLSPEEMLEVSMVHSLAGELLGGKIATRRPFRAPHHSASMAALVPPNSSPASECTMETSILRDPAAVCSRLPPDSAGGAHAGRSRRCGGGLALARCRGPELPRRDVQAAAGGLSAPSGAPICARASAGPTRCHRSPRRVLPRDKRQRAR